MTGYRLSLSVGLSNPYIYYIFYKGGSLTVSSSDGNGVVERLGQTFK